MNAGHHIMVGEVWHRRVTPVEHRFAYGMKMLLVDLDDLDHLFSASSLVGKRHRLLTLRNRDFVDEEDAPLAGKARDKARDLGLDFSRGRLLMLAQPRGLCWQFNPLVLYFHFPDGATRPAAVLAEVRNTPWHERHWYALSSADGGALTFFRHEKAFHVSPYLPMEMQYQWELDWSEPLTLCLSVLRKDETVFQAGLRLAFRPLGESTPLRQWAALSLQGMKTSFGIYWQALRLWRKKVPFYRHPEGSVREGGH